jgi:hypothetical protein
MVMIARTARSGEIGGVADTLADAFSDDPVFRWTARFDGDMTSRLRTMFTSMAKQRMKLDDLLVCVAAGGDDEPGAAEVGAAALWYEPGRKLSWGVGTVRAELFPMGHRAGDAPGLVAGERPSE